MDSNTLSRKRGRSPGNKNQCGKPKAIRGVKARRMEPIPVEDQRMQVSSVDGNIHTHTTNNHTNTNNNDNTAIPTKECSNHCTISTLNDSIEYTASHNNQNRSSNNNNGDSPISIRQLDSVYAYGRNNDSNININNHNTPSQDLHNHNPIINSIHINNISQPDLHSSLL